MTLGQKIKLHRTRLGLTQNDVCADKITRNMLSAIETDKATPSLSTLSLIADQLSVPMSYLISEEDDLCYYEKKHKLNDIKLKFVQNDWGECLKLCNTIHQTDDEIEYIKAICNFKIGRREVLDGNLKSGSEYLKDAISAAYNTIYDTSSIENLILIYSALAANIQAPLLEFNSDEFESNMKTIVDMDLYKYLLNINNYEYSNELYSKHLNAKELIRNNRYSQAVDMLIEIDELRKTQEYNSYLTLSLYADLEECYRQLGDYKNAYRMSSKRLTLFEQFIK